MCLWALLWGMDFRILHVISWPLRITSSFLSFHTPFNVNISCLIAAPVNSQLEEWELPPALPSVFISLYLCITWHTYTYTHTHPDTEANPCGCQVTHPVMTVIRSASQTFTEVDLWCNQVLLVYYSSTSWECCLSYLINVNRALPCLLCLLYSAVQRLQS